MISDYSSKKLVRCELTITSKKNDRGSFKLAELEMPFVTCEVTHSWINDYEDGTYIGDFLVDRIFNKVNVCPKKGGIRVSFKAAIKEYVLYPNNAVPETSDSTNLYEHTKDLERQISLLKDNEKSMHMRLADLTEMKSSVERENTEVAEQLLASELLVSELEAKLANERIANKQVQDELSKLKMENAELLQDAKNPSVKEVTDLVSASEVTIQNVCESECSNDLFSEKENEVDSKQCVQQTDVISNNSPNTKGTSSKTIKPIISDPRIKEVFGDYFGDVVSVDSLPDVINLKDIDEDIVSDRTRLSKITKLLHHKHGGGYNFEPKNLKWERH